MIVADDVSARIPDDSLNLARGYRLLALLESSVFE